MEIDAQILVGAAVTVFLALLFFGVVVLWDVALAIRSLGDKIDKLEDSVDDDLTEINHSLDGLSVGGTSGTQLHLSGGTIQSGPTPEQGHSQPAGVGHGPNTHPQAGQASSSAQGHPGNQPPASTTEQPHRADDDHAPGESNRTDDHASHEQTEADDAVVEAADEDEPTDAEPADRDDEEPRAETPAHPRAAENRGRFITSPDRTPWYAMGLDYEAIDAAKPQIAGELEAATATSDDDDEEVATVIALDPVETDSGDDASSSAESADGTESSVADADAKTDTADGAGDAKTDTDDEVTAAADDSDTDRDATDTATRDDEVDDEVSDQDGSNTDTEQSPADDTEADVGPSAVDENEERTANDAEASAEARSDDSTEDDGEDNADDDAETAGNESGIAGDDSGNTDSSVVSFDESDDADTSNTDENADASNTGVDVDTSSTEEDDESPADMSEIEFDIVDGFEAETDDVSVDEAVDTMNEDEPDLSLSGRGFDVTAESTPAGAVLQFDFDPETTPIDESTERLLTYQLRSFAENESTPDAEIHVNQNRLVIDLEDVDGSEIQQWGESAVEIIDRTLYLSDNSG